MKHEELIEACLWAAKELKEAAQGFEADFAENGHEHLADALEYIEEIKRLLKEAR